MAHTRGGMRGTTDSTARKFVAKSAMDRKGPSFKNLNSRRRPQGPQVPTGRIGGSIKGPDLGAG